MENDGSRAIAIVGTGAVLPDAADVEAFWKNVKEGRYSITEVDPARWDPKLYYDADRSAPDKTYSTIGGWVRERTWDPVKWKLAIPPRVIDAMDESQRWAIACTRAALEDYGYPKRPLDVDRTAVILGNAMAGEKHYFTALRLYFPEYAQELAASASFAALPEKVRETITRELHDRMAGRIPEVTEDTMPGELSNCIAGRIANTFNLHGPNYVVDAACASAMAAFNAAVDGLIEGDFDVAITGGIDRNMGASTYVKFCKIGALSATGTRPYAEGADGFVMGEGAAIFLLKRLADAERNQDRIYAVIRGIGGASDGKGKGITAPNPVGQKLAIERGWKNAGVAPSAGTYMEGHGTSTTVGDVVEAESLAEVLRKYSLPNSSVPLGSVKSNIGHLKGAAGAAGILKAALALRDKVLPPSVHCEQLNPNIDFAHSPLYVNRELKPWTVAADDVRRAGVSAFGFGGTNFHVVMEEHIPHRLTGNGKRTVAVGEVPAGVISQQKPGFPAGPHSSSGGKAPLRGALVIGGESESSLSEKLAAIQKAAAAGRAPAIAPPEKSDLRAAERLVIDFADASDLANKSGLALKALTANQPAMWKALRAQGIFRGHGPAAKVAFLYTGQGSQYVNMLRALRESEAIVKDTFAEADRIMTPLLGKPLSDFIFVDSRDPKAVAKAEDDLRQTEITQPAVLATDQAMTRLLAAYGIAPDMTMGHSLGEYGALVGAGALPFEDALEAVSARGRGMTAVAMNDNGKMAAVFAPIEEIERTLKTIDGYVVIANINSNRQGVIGGASKAVEQAMAAFQKAGYEPVELPVSHAFHTSIVAGAGVPLRRELERLRLHSARIPVVANVDGEFYPMGPDVLPKMLDILTKQVASPVQFVKGLKTLYAAGARIFVEVGPKKALQGFAEDVLGSDSEVISIFTNHPKLGDVVAFNQALCGLYAAGLGLREEQEMKSDIETVTKKAVAAESARRNHDDRYSELGQLFAGLVDQGWELLHGGHPTTVKSNVVITGAALGLPGTDHIFDDGNVGRILRGEQFIDTIPTRFRRAMVDKNITRLVKSDNGAPTFESINSLADSIKLAGRGRGFDLGVEFGVAAERIPALDRATRLAIAVGMDALRDAGIPLVMHYRTTTKGTQLPDRWMLPETLRDDTGVIFASAFPGYDSFADEMSRYWQDHGRREELATLESIRTRTAEKNGNSAVLTEIDRRIEELKAVIEKSPYVFDRRFLFRVLSMGHSQFAEYIGARGPNTAVNGACASTAQAVSLAEGWIHAARCKRVIVVSADDVTSDNMLEWIGAGFLATGAAATDEVLEEAALPFDRRRHGMLIGMGAAGLIVESEQGARERGIQPICEVLGAVTANSAFHGTRLDVQHIGQVMEHLVAEAEKQHGIRRSEIAPQMVFVSHETYTPARGGSASAEIHALRRVFGESADKIVIANTKGFTGHAMGAGIEDVVAVKSLETGLVPPVANFKEIDPELGALNLSKGGAYPVQYALRLAAGFGSQISMTLLRWVKTRDGARRNPNSLGYAYRIADQQAWNEWLTKMTGHPGTELEVVTRTLRVTAAGARTESKVVKMPARTSDSAVARPPAVAAEAVPIQKTVISCDAMGAPGASLKEVAKDAVKERVLALVAEKTGYPTDMLDLDLDLEADLGVDTVKQAEMFAAVREIYNIPRDENRKLRDYPTLSHVIRFVYEKRPDLAGTAIEQKQPIIVGEKPETLPKTNDKASAAEDVTEKVLEIVAQKTGYPKDMLDLDLDLEADLGVDTVKQAEMFAAVREIYNIPRDENRKLRDYPTLAHVIRFVHEKRPDLAGSLTGEKPAAVALTEAIDAKLPDDPKTAASNDVKEKVLEIVAQKTGYPKDMLDLDLDLEADLGVDTVKQAEMFAAVRELYNIPRDENRKLRDYPTLARVIQFVYEKRPDLVGTSAMPKAKEPIAAPAPSADAIKEKVLEIVAQKTGYPKDMLDLDLDLEADLGVDTVKQAEMFASVRAAYNIPRDADLKLRDFPTLAHVIQFARERAGSAVATPATPVQQKPSEAKPTRTLASFEATDRIPRRVPVPVLRPPLKTCKPTGVTLAAGKRVIVMPDKSGVAEALTQSLKQHGVEVLRIEGTPDPEALVASLKGWLSSGAIHGLYWLPALDDEGSISDLNPTDWREALRVRVKLLYHTMRTLYEHIAPKGTFLISATRLGGQHGYDEAGATSPLGGAVSGFTKAYKRERMDALVKTVDFEAGHAAGEIADLLIAETLQDPGAIEVGYKRDLRWSVGLEEKPAADGQSGMKLGKDSVFVITGAAGSIVSAITSDLAAASGGTFYLLDLIPEPNPANPDLARFSNDRENLKLDLFRRIQARGERATPAMVEKELAGLERAVAAKNAINAVKAAGGTARYFSVNLTDAAAVAQVIEQVRKESGRIDVLLHAAGMERSHFLPDKDPKEFDLVFDVKADGWFNLLHAIGKMQLGASVAFSSIAGRFGNGGQTDYSSANDLLCKITSSFRTARPGTRGIVIDWTAWGGIGMATRGSIPKMMEAAGIDMLPPEAGIPLIRRELTTGATRGEIVVGQRLGAMLAEIDEAGGLDTGALQGKSNLRIGPMVGNVIGARLQDGLRIETALDPAVQPFLGDHKIDGTPVLPGVMGIEAFAEAAHSVLPDWHVVGLENIDFMAPVKFYRSEPRTLTVKSAFHEQREGVSAYCELSGARTLPNQTEPQLTKHFTGTVQLSRQPASASKGPAIKIPSISSVESQLIYQLYFHGPAYQVLERAWWDGERVVGLFAKDMPANHLPKERPLCAAPRLIELCFQTAGLWEMGTQGRMGLPQHIDAITFFAAPEQPQGPLYAVVVPHPASGTFDAEVVDAGGTKYLKLSGYRTVVLADSVSEEALKALQAVMSLQAAVA